MLIEQKWEVWKAEISILIPRLNQYHLPSRDCKVSYRARIMTKRLSLSFNHSVNLKDMLHDTAELCRWRLGKKEEKISKDEGESNGVIPYIPIINFNEACFDQTRILPLSFLKLYHHKGLMGGHGLGSLNMRGAEPLKQVRVAESSHETSSRQGEISNAYKFENWLVWLRYRSRKEQIWDHCHRRGCLANVPRVRVCITRTLHEDGCSVFGNPHSAVEHPKPALTSIIIMSVFPATAACIEPLVDRCLATKGKVKWNGPNSPQTADQSRRTGRQHAGH